MSSGQLTAQVALLTITIKLQLATVLFDASFAVQLTVVEPNGKVKPEAGLQVVVMVGQPLEVGFE
jgi:hypothetical protein